MSIFKHRPLALGCLIFLVLLYLSYDFEFYAYVTEICVGVFASLFALIFIYRAKRNIFKEIATYLIPISLALVLCGGLAIGFFHTDKAKADKLDGADGTYEILIEDVAYESETLCGYIGYIEELDIKVALVTYDSEPELGDILSADIYLSKLTEDTGFESLSRHKQDRILLVAECFEFDVVSRDNTNVKIFFKKLNREYSEIIKNRVSSDTSSVICALFLGDRSGISESDSRDYARLGISHILALSGMHLSILAAVVSHLFRKIKIKRQIKYILTTVVIWLFVALTGFSESVMRAAIMLSIYYLLFMFRVQSDFITRIFASVSIICIFSPYSVYSLGLLLSFMAVIGCAICSHLTIYSERGSKIKLIPLGILGTGVIVLFTLPVTFLKFGFISSLSIPANLIMIPVFTLLLYLSPFVLLFGGIPVVGNVICIVTEWITENTLFLVRNLSSLKFAIIPFNSDIHKYAVLVIFAAFLGYLMLGKKQAKYCFISVLVGVMIFAGGSVYSYIDSSNNSYVYTIEEKSGDYTFIETDNDLTVVANRAISRSSSSTLYSYIVSYGYVEIENLFVTDYTYRMYNSIDKITDITYVRNVYLPIPLNDEEQKEYDRILSNLSQKNVNVHKITGQNDINDIEITFGAFEKLPRSTKRLVVYSVNGENTKYTYVGASVYESDSLSKYAQKHIHSSSIVYFGSYGPKPHKSFKFNLVGVDYVMMTELAKKFSNCNTFENKLLPTDKKFILK